MNTQSGLSMTIIRSWQSNSGINTGIVSPHYLIYLHALLSLSCTPACLISWPAWKITSLALFRLAWVQKDPPNPAACSQLIFLVATLLTAPPTDSVRRVLEEKKEREGGREDVLHRALGCLHTPVSVLWDVSHLAFSITTHPHPPSSPPLHLVSIMPADQTPDQLVFGCHIPSYPAQLFYPTHRTSISWLHQVLILPFFPPSPSSVRFHICTLSL